jgi:hypothetical protein
MALAQILARIERVASIIETDAKSPWNKERAREIQKLVQLAKDAGDGHKG